MSIDRRLRSGLAANTEILAPALVDELHQVVRRVRRRHRARIAGFAGAAAVVVVAAVVWAPGVVEGMRDQPLPGDRTITPSPTRLATLPDGEAVTPGIYAGEFPARARPAVLPVALITVPEGYLSSGSAGVYANEGGFRHIDLWTVAEVAQAPCSGPLYSDPGPTVQDLADALAALPVWESTKPKPVTVGGYDGLVMDFNVPDNPPKGCAEPYHWRDDAGGTQGIGLGKHQRLWILDIAGERVMIVAGWFPVGAPDPYAGVTPAQAQELLAMAGGITFADPVSASP